MKTRVITAIILIALLVPVLVFSGTVVLTVVAAFCSAVAVYEALKCIGTVDKPALSVPLFISSVAINIAAWLCRNYGAERFVFVASFIAAITTIYLLLVMVVSKGKISISDISGSAFLSLYIAFAFASILVLRYYSSIGGYIYLLVFIGAWITDTFAYFTGMLFGKHKLIPEISPKKTIEGSIGGTVFCAATFVAYGLIISKALKVIALGESDYVILAVCGIIVSVISQIGDLSMSAVKRHYGVKDFGKIFPGHGGMLDRVDSVMAVALALFIFNEVVGVFNV